MPLVQHQNLGELGAHFGLLLGVGRAAFFDIAQVYKVVQFVIALLENAGDFDYAQLDQGRAADGLLHPQFAALHAASQVDFAFPRE